MLWGQAVPVKMYVQMDLQTGIRRAKLMDLTVPEHRNELIVQPVDSGRSREPSQDVTTMHSLAEQLRLSVTNLTATITILKQMELLAHDYKHGVALCTPPQGDDSPLELILALLSHENVKLTQLVMRIVGAAAQNNEDAMKLLNMRADLMPTLLNEF